MSQQTRLPQQQLLARMKKAKLRLTKPRVAMAGMLALWQRPFTSNELIEDLGRSGVGVHRATVFRDLTTLVKIGILRQVQVTGSKGRYFALAHDRSGHFLVCEQCGKVSPVQKNDIILALKRWAVESREVEGWKMRAHELESYGICPECVAREKKIHV